MFPVPVRETRLTPPYRFVKFEDFFLFFRDRKRFGVVQGFIDVSSLFRDFSMLDRRVIAQQTIQDLKLQARGLRLSELQARIGNIHRYDYG